MLLRLKTACQVVVLAAGLALLAACLKVGTSEGSNAILLNASVLKGVMGYGTVTAFNRAGDIVWQGEADEGGNIAMDIRDNLTGILRVSVAPNERSFIVCDAVECSDPQTEQSMAFGEPVPLSANVDFELSTRVYVDGGNTLISSLQINGLTELTSQLLTFIAADDVIDSKESFALQAELASQLILVSLGLPLSDNLNLLDFSLINVNENLEFGEKAENDSLLSILNAGFANDLRNIRAFTNALNALILNVTQPRLQDDFEAIQKRVLRHVLNLAQSGRLGGIAPGVMRQIEQAANREFNFDQFILRLAEMNNTANVFSLPSPKPFVAEYVTLSVEVSALSEQKEAQQQNPQDPQNFAKPPKTLAIQGFNSQGKWQTLTQVTADELSHFADSNGNATYRVWLSTLTPYLAYRAVRLNEANAVQQNSVQHSIKVVALSAEPL